MRFIKSVVAFSLLASVSAPLSVSNAASVSAPPSEKADTSMYVSGMFVKYAPGVSPSEGRLARGSQALSQPLYLTSRKIAGFNFVRLSQPVSPARADVLASHLRSLSSVLDASPSDMRRHFADPVLPNDPEFGKQWHLQSPFYDDPSMDFNAAGTQTEFAWNTPPVSVPTIAVIDTGITSHPDLTRV